MQLMKKKSAITKILILLKIHADGVLWNKLLKKIGIDIIFRRNDIIYWQWSSPSGTLSRKTKTRFCSVLSIFCWLQVSLLIGVLISQRSTFPFCYRQASSASRSREDDRQKSLATYPLVVLSVWRKCSLDLNASHFNQNDWSRIFIEILGRIIVFS